MDKRNEFDRRTGRRPVPTANAIPRTIEPTVEHELAAARAENQPWQRYPGKKGEKGRGTGRGGPPGKAKGKA